MKTSMFLLAGMLSSLVVMGQVDSISQPPALPQGEYGTPGVPREDVGEEKEDRVEIDREELPPAMKDALNNEEKYKGWEDSPVYFERNTDQYLIHIKGENTTQTFRFDKRGKPILTDAPLEERESRQ